MQNLLQRRCTRDWLCFERVTNQAATCAMIGPQRHAMQQLLNLVFFTADPQTFPLLVTVGMSSVEYTAEEVPSVYKMIQAFKMTSGIKQGCC